MTGNPRQIPNSKVPVLLPDGSLTLPWRLYLQNLPSMTDVTSSGVTSFDGRTGAVVLNEEDVVTALGFTPGVGTVTVTPPAVLGQTAVFKGAAAVGTNNALPAGFGFFAGGLLKAEELLGTVVWGTPKLFRGTINDVVRALFAPTNNAVLPVSSYDSSGNRFTVASIVIAAGSFSGSLTWIGGVYINPGVPLELNAPAVADPTLASVRMMAYSS